MAGLLGTVQMTFNGLIHGGCRNAPCAGLSRLHSRAIGIVRHGQYGKTKTRPTPCVPEDCLGVTGILMEYIH